MIAETLDTSSRHHLPDPPGWCGPRLPVANPLSSFPAPTERCCSAGGRAERGGVGRARGRSLWAQVRVLSQSPRESLSNPGPNSLQLHPSSSASAGCNPHSRVSSISPTPGSPAVLHPHLLNSSTPSSLSIAQARVLSRASRPPPATPTCALPGSSSTSLSAGSFLDPRAHPFHGSTRPHFRISTFAHLRESSRRPLPTPYLNPLEAREM